MIKATMPTKAEKAKAKEAQKEFKAISSTPSGVDRGRDGDIDIEKDSRTGCGVYLALMLFGMSANLVMYAIWVQMPILTTKLPEGHLLSYYMLGLLEVGNVTALMYLMARKCSRTEPNEVPGIYLGLLVNLIALILITFFWEHSVTFGGQGHSVVFMLCVFFISLVTCYNGVTYIPMAARLKAGYITAVLLGDAISALIPHALGLGEGLATQPECSKRTDYYKYNLSMTIHQGYLRPGYRRPSTTPVSITPPTLRFSEFIFFLVIVGLQALSFVAFLLLRNIPSCRFEYDEIKVDCMDDDHPIEDDVFQTNCDGPPYVNVLDDGSIRQSFRPDTQHPKGVHKPRPKHGSPTKPVVSFRGPVERVRVLSHTSGSSRNTSSAGSHRDLTDPLNIKDLEKQIPSFTILMLITFWASAVTSGPLSSSKAHVCLPSGNIGFFVGTIVTNFGNLITCLVVLRVSARLKVTMVVAMTALATILLTYLVALVAFSLQSESLEDSPIFGNFGILLTTVAWFAIAGLFFFARVTIAVICRHHGRDSMIWYAAVSQMGVAFGAFCLVENVSICRVYRTYQEMFCNNRN